MENQIVLKVLNEIGYVVLDVEDDFNLQDYIVDSLQFIEFIIGIEKEIGFALSEDFLDYNLLLSTNGFSEKLNKYITDVQTESQSQNTTE